MVEVGHRPFARPYRRPRRDNDGNLVVTMPARLASGAMQSGEHGPVLIYAVAQALDATGSGRALIQDVARELRVVYRGRHVARWLEHPKAGRYWRVDRQYLVLRGMRAVLDSFECELPDNGLAIHVSMGLLDFPRRRNAFLLAAVMAGADHYRSRAFVEKFARVNRKTLGLWKRDPVIWDQLLGWEPRWAEAST